MKIVAALAISPMLFLWGAACIWAQVTGAQIAEQNIENVLVVDQLHLRASDNNPGTQELPFETISGAVRAALMYNRNNIGAKILLMLTDFVVRVCALPLRPL